MAQPSGNGRLTTRLRLEPAVSARAADLWIVQSDDNVWPWYSSQAPNRAEVERQAEHMGDSWRLHGVHKWIEAVVSCTTRHNLRSRAVMERIGMRHAGEIQTRGVVERASEERDDVPHTVHVLLREDWTPDPGLWKG